VRPDLPKPFQHALDTIVGELSAAPEVVGILFFGSAARGAPQAHSDVDLYALTSEPNTGHLGRDIEGIPVEVSFASVSQMGAHVDEERPIVVHAFATGLMLLDRTKGELTQLCRRAAALWTRGPSPIADATRLRLRFHLTDLVRDLDDLPETSLSTALVGADCVRLAIESFCAARQLWMPGLRNVAEIVGQDDPDFGDSIRDCAAAGFSQSTSKRLALRALAELGGTLVSYDTRLIV
jgi:hypothetical protein